MPVRYRRVKPEEIARNLKLLEPDRPLLSPAVWKALPQVLADLLERERILLCTVEETDSGELLFFGGSGFVHPAFLQAAVDRTDQTILDLAFAMESKRTPAFLNVKEVAEANRNTDLRLLVFFGTTGALQADGPNASVALSLVLEAWNFFHTGFQFREIWALSADPVQAELLRVTSLRLYRHSAHRGVPTWLFTTTRDEALRNPTAWPRSHMLSPRPTLGFTRAQQKLLELALLDQSDREAAIELGISADAVKKRWRSIYNKVAQAKSGRAAKHNGSGADRRRLLLQRLRSNLAELRPF